MRPILPLLIASLGVACAPESVRSVTLSPETPEVEVVLRAADARWEAAGVAPERIQIGPGGAPVRLVPERAPVSETRVTYRGSALVRVRWIELDSLDTAVATHELGHALGIGPGVVSHPIEHETPEACAPDAPDRPTMCAHVGSVLTARDLELACAAGACTHFTPEAE